MFGKHEKKKFFYKIWYIPPPSSYNYIELRELFYL